MLRRAGQQAAAPPILRPRRHKGAAAGAARRNRPCLLQEVCTLCAKLLVLELVLRLLLWLALLHRGSQACGASSEQCLLFVVFLLKLVFLHLVTGSDGSLPASSVPPPPVCPACAGTSPIQAKRRTASRWQVTLHVTPAVKMVQGATHYGSLRDCAATPGAAARRWRRCSGCTTRWRRPRRRAWPRRRTAPTRPPWPPPACSCWRSCARA